MTTILYFKTCKKGLVKLSMTNFKVRNFSFPPKKVAKFPEANEQENESFESLPTFV